MACLISFGLSTNLFYPKIQVQGTTARRLTRIRCVRPVLKRTAKRLLLSNCSGGDILTLSRSYCWDIMPPTRQFCETMMHHFGLSFSAYVRISGFWMGPDVEDGWGFVEAFIHRIYYFW